MRQKLLPQNDHVCMWSHIVSGSSLVRWSLHSFRVTMALSRCIHLLVFVWRWKEYISVTHLLPGLEWTDWNGIDPNSACYTHYPRCTVITCQNVVIWGHLMMTRGGLHNDALSRYLMFFRVCAMAVMLYSMTLITESLSHCWHVTTFVSFLPLWGKCGFSINEGQEKYTTNLCRKSNDRSFS